MCRHGLLVVHCVFLQKFSNHLAMGSSSLFLLRVLCVASVLWIIADSMGDNANFDAWEAMLKNLSRQGKNWCRSAFLRY